MPKSFKNIVIGIAFGIIVIAAATGGAISDRLFGYSLLDKYWPRLNQALPGPSTNRVVTEENVIIDVAEKVSPSVVTVSIKQTAVRMAPFGFFGTPQNSTDLAPQDIGSGFILTSDGLIVTNKHVVSATSGTYRIVTQDDKTYDVQKIYRDPANDLAILKIDPGPDNALKPVELGDSSKIKVGQLAIAIGTALGEFRHTVTTGVVSGLGRGINAGSPFEGSVEHLDDVIQTDAAINPGNSGGPLLNSSGQVIGVNTAVSSSGQNIGFAIPINIIKDAIANFNETGQFNRPYLGVRYTVINQQTALLNDVPQGAYLQEVLEASPADKGGLQPGDIVTKFDGVKILGDDILATEISRHKVGDKVEIEYWRSEKLHTTAVILEEAQ